MRTNIYTKTGELTSYALHCGQVWEHQGYRISVRHGVFFAIPPAVDDGTQQIRQNYTARTKRELLAKIK